MDLGAIYHELMAGGGAMGFVISLFCVIYWLLTCRDLPVAQDKIYYASVTLWRISALNTLVLGYIAAFFIYRVLSDLSLSDRSDVFIIVLLLMFSSVVLALVLPAPVSIVLLKSSKRPHWPDSPAGTRSQGQDLE